MGEILFDPWTATLEHALQARAHHDPTSGKPDPLAQHGAAQYVQQARPYCEMANGGCAVLLALRVCTLHRLLVPEWLSDLFVGRHSLVVEAEVGSWDEAFGRPWPGRTRLATVRRHRRLKREIHAAVWQRLADDPNRPVSRDLFEEIGELKGICASGSLTERLYLEALQEGMPNALLLRRSVRPKLRTESVGRGSRVLGTASSLRDRGADEHDS